MSADSLRDTDGMGSHVGGIDDADTTTSDAKSRIMEKIRRDMQKKDEPAILAFDKSTSHSRYTSG